MTLSDHASLAPLDVLEAPEPIALLIPLDPSLAANPEPSACNASEAAAGLCGVCDASDARLTAAQKFLRGVAVTKNSAEITDATDIDAVVVSI